MNRPKIILGITTHQEEKVLLIKFFFNREIAENVKISEHARWSTTLKSWYVPYSFEAVKKVKLLFEPLYQIDAEALRQRKNTQFKYE